MMPLRVLLITTAYPSQAGGPRGSFIELLARHLHRQGVTVTVLAPGAPGAPLGEHAGGVRVVRARYWFDRSQRLATGVGGIVPNLRHQPWLAAQLPGLLASLTAAAWKLAVDVDLIHSHWVYPSGIVGVLAARRRGLPLIVTSHGGDLNLARRVPPLRWASRWVSEHADVCVGVSHAMVSRFQELGVPPERVRFLPLGVEVEDRITPAEPQEKDRTLKVIYVGSLIPRKSVETLLLAQAELQRRGCHCKAMIVGSGPSENSLRELSATCDLHGITFVGEKPHSAIPALMRSADVLVLPSLSEGRGVVILEAMALGLAVVASDIPGPREIVIPERTGLLFEPGNPNALAEALERLASDPIARVEYGLRGRAFLEAEGLSVERSASAHVELYRGVLAAARASANMQRAKTGRARA